MKFGIVLITFLIISVVSVHAQYFGAGFSPYTGINSPSGNLAGQSPARFNLQTGASFGTGYGNGSLFSTYIAPSFNQNLSKKFTLTAGAVISNTTFNNTALWNSEGQLTPVSGNLTTFTLYTSGAYQVNERLTVTGSAYKTINPAFNARLNPDQLQMEAQGMSVGFGYKVGENLHIGAEIRMQQGNSNFYNPYVNPFGNSYRSGFYGY